MKTQADVIQFIYEYKEIHGFLTEDNEIIEFVKELQKQIADMSFEIPQLTVNSNAE